LRGGGGDDRKLGGTRTGKKTKLQSILKKGDPQKRLTLQQRRGGKWGSKGKKEKRIR